MSIQEIMKEYTIKTGIKFNYSRSFKLKSDCSFEDRPLYRLYSDERLLFVFIEMLKNNIDYSHLKNRYNGKMLSFISTRDDRENYIKISICPLVFNVGECVCYGVEFDNGNITYSNYDCLAFDKEVYNYIPECIKMFIREDHTVLREHDKQHYFLMKQFVPLKVLFKLSRVKEYRKWLLDNSDCYPFWFQICKDSMTLYIKKDIEK